MLESSKSVALVTGASTGIGRTVASRLASAGYRVFGTSRNPEDRPASDAFEMIALDVRDAASVSAGVSTVLDTTGRIDVLVNNAGFVAAGAAEEMSEAELRSQFETNFFGLVKVTLAVLPHMRSRRSGRIINMSSVLGEVGAPFASAYAASKFAVEGYTEALHHEVTPFGVEVSLLAPGFIRTSILDNAVRAARTVPEYDPWRQRMEIALTKAMASAPSADLVASAVLEAARAKKPRLRYPIGREAGMIAALRRLLPEGLFLGMVRKQFGLDKVDPAAAAPAAAMPKRSDA